MPDKFIKRNGRIYMLFAVLNEGRLDFSPAANMELPPDVWRQLVETAMLPEQQNLLSVQDAAVALGVSPGQLVRMAEQGMPAVDVSTEGAERRSLRFDIAACRAWLSQNRKYTPAPQSEPVQEEGAQQ